METTAAVPDWATKGLWLPEPADVIGRHLFDGVASWPVMIARQRALTANIATMAAYCARHGVAHAPHGKTMMSPQLFRAQLDAGAWGITVATANQALVARHFGVPRVLLANELLDPVALRWAAAQVGPDTDFLCYVDSLTGVEIAGEALAGTGLRLPVLVELGFAGGRTGCRDVAEATAVAKAAAATPGLHVAGVTGFEGMVGDVAEVTAFLTELVAAGEAIAPLARTAAPFILTAGGSAFFDACVAVLGPAAAAHGWQVILRSGAYVSHDHGLYADTSAFTRVAGEGALTAALEVWAQVLSAPEPGLALLSAGKRDVPTDAGLPVPLGVRTRAGDYHDLIGASIDRTNDQHAYLRGAVVAPGDLVKLGISHPCTAFDKWRMIPVLDDDDRIIDVLQTYF